MPPALYGGSERVVSYLTEELVRKGHEVTLFASGESITKAKLIAPCRRALRLDPGCCDPLAYHTIMLDEVFVARVTSTSFIFTSITCTFLFLAEPAHATSPRCMGGWISLS